MMRVLILGADGFVGRHLVRSLAATDWAVPVAGRRRPSSRSEESLIPDLILDARDRSAIQAALNTVDAVVNCVAGDAQTIVQNAEALFAAATWTGKPVVYLSSMAAYGSATGLIQEDAPLLGDLGPYSAAKVRAESFAAAAPAVTILRPGCIYGADSPQWTLRIARLLRQHRIGDLGSAGDAPSNLVHITDVVAAVLAVLAALQRKATGVRAYNLAMRDSPEWNEYFIQFAQVIHSVPVSRIGRRSLQLETGLFAIPLKILERLSGGRTPEAITPSLGRLWQQHIRLDSTRAEQELGIHWTPLAAGLAEAARRLGT